MKAILKRLPLNFMAITAILAIFKLAGFINWSWLIVTILLWIVPAIITTGMVLVVITIFVASIFGIRMKDSSLYIQLKEKYGKK